MSLRKVRTAGTKVKDAARIRAACDQQGKTNVRCSRGDVALVGKYDSNAF